MFLITATTNFMIIDGCQFDTISIENYLYEISNTKILINNTQYSNIQSFNTYIIYIYASSKLIMKTVITDSTSNGLFEIKDVDSIMENSIFSNENSSYSFRENNLENSLINLQKNRLTNQFIIKNSSFIGHSTSKNGSVINSVLFQGIFSLQNCTFQNNQAFDYGGSIYLYYLNNITISSCNFISNNAGQGGSIYYDNSAMNLNDIFILRNNVFTKNSANSSGGAIMFYDKVSEDVKNNVFSLNQASKYGNDTASEPKRVLFTSLNSEYYNNSYLNDLQSTPFATFEIPSGVKLNISLSFVITDHFYQKVNKSLIEYIISFVLIHIYLNFFRSPQINLVPFANNNFEERHKPKLLGDSRVTIKDGLFTFQNLIVYGDFSTSYVLLMSPIVIKSKSLLSDYSFKNEIIFNETYSYYFPITVSSCFYGQIIKLYSNDSNITFCQSCSPGTFSINPTDSCASCPFGANCIDGILDVSPGFWRMEANVYSCPLDSCL